MKNIAPTTLKLLVWFMAWGLSLHWGLAQHTGESTTYTLVVEGFDWGPGANKVILPWEGTLAQAKASDFSVTAYKTAAGTTLPKAEAEGPRKVVHAYVSDEEGRAIPKGKHLTLVLFVSPLEAISSPMKYLTENGRGINKWVKYQLKIRHLPSKREWNTEGRRLRPQIDRFDLSGTFSLGKTKLTYAHFVPEERSGKKPLIIWLHGGGEGGTDPSIALAANKATNYASPEIQAIFNGAHVLVPQTPTFWMQNAQGRYTRGKENDIYNEALMELIKMYVENHPNIDTRKIYIGGCSNGGYMSLKLVLRHPHYFAAAYISALAYEARHITDAQIASIAHVPIWFIHAKDDTVTPPEDTVVPLYKRLRDAGATKTHFSYYDHVVDLSGLFGGADFHYNGHLSWIYSHSNHAHLDFNGGPVMAEGRPVNLLQWMALQQKP
ncbi:prolyl oligopeptidase family serine peptidase [Maribacter sp. 2307ULW6-5]|uniref:prolyl oligopeptidase family serine peptidase n=1 Tax=Maribacter sp. 2307ULW6-5 TaxID=3386275 RepID=UPI0039BCA27E